MNHRLHLFVAEHNGTQHFVFGQLISLRFHHHHRVLRSRNHQIKPLFRVVAQFVHVINRRVKHIFAVGKTNPRRRNRPHERHAGNHQRGRSSDERHDIGIILQIMAQDRADNLGLVFETFNKQWPDRTVDQPRGQGFLFGRTRFAFEETARNFTGGIILFLIMHGQRKEIEAFFRLFLEHYGGMHCGLAIGGDNRAIGLTGHFAGLQRQRLIAPLDGFFVDFEHLVSLQRQLPPGNSAIRGTCHRPVSHGPASALGQLASAFGHVWQVSESKRFRAPARALCKAKRARKGAFHVGISDGYPGA